MPKKRHTWKQIYKKALEITDVHGPMERLFRGHSDASWELMPSLARMSRVNQSMEHVAYFDYVAMAGALLSEGISSWSIAVSMQHHGLPTRLLDWTDSFSVALFFALKDKSKTSSCVWILDPFTLNKQLAGTEELLNISEMVGSYEEAFSREKGASKAKVIAFAPNRHHPRVSSQKSLFTMHYDIETPIENLCPDAVTKIEIPYSAKKEAWDFITLAGISEFSLFPDLDGLARELCRRHFE